MNGGSFQRWIARSKTILWVLFVCTQVPFPAGLSEQPQPGSSRTADADAQSLVRDLLSERPTKPIAIRGVFKVRHAYGRTIEVPVAYTVRIDSVPWQSVYQTEATPNQGRQELVIDHETALPNRYRLTRFDLAGAKAGALTLTGVAACIPFAGTDFWLADLGLEFLHWPAQRLVHDAKITMRLGRPCKVLESINPVPGESLYARVLSWIDTQTGGLIRAEAYDRNDKRLKVFFLHGFTKVNGHWQVKDMEIQNDQADSRTILEFNYQED
jgi:hypothetical protein